MWGKNVQKTEKQIILGKKKTTTNITLKKQAEKEITLENRGGKNKPNNKMDLKKKKKVFQMNVVSASVVRHSEKKTKLRTRSD